MSVQNIFYKIGSQIVKKKTLVGIFIDRLIAQALQFITIFGVVNLFNIAIKK